MAYPSITLNDVPETSYAPCGDLSLAYQVVGDGPVEVVWCGSFASHVELFWSMPEYQSLMDRLGAFARIAIFDKAGVGLSDPVAGIRTLDERADEIEAVMDAAGFTRAALIGVSEGGPASLLFAATRPDRTRALILTGTTPWSAGNGWEDLECDPAELQARTRNELGDRYTPSVEQYDRVQVFWRATRSEWGTGVALQCAMSEVRSPRQLGMLERMCASPGMARATLAAGFRLDVRPVLPTITVPTLIIHANRDPAVPVQFGRYLADHIAGARIIEIDSADHAPWFSDPDTITSEIEKLLTGTKAAPPQSRRALRTVLFTDIVASTERAAATGDERWRATLARFEEITGEAGARFDGAVVKSTGDGHLITFDGPTQAIRCAEALRDSAEKLGVEIRVGIHTGECELMADDVGGIAVHIAARILSQAGAGDILVSRTVRDLVVGSGTGFEERGSVELPGVPGEWELLAVDRHGAQPNSAESKLVATPTPSPRAAMRPADRAVAMMAKRTPWILRGVARIATQGNS